MSKYKLQLKLLAILSIIILSGCTVYSTQISTPDSSSDTQIPAESVGTSSQTLPTSTFTPSPTKTTIPTPTNTIEPTPTEEIPEWVTVYDDDGIPIEVVQSSTGERFEVVLDSFVYEDKLMVIDEETGEWDEVAEIFTMQELMEQVPTKQEMIDFLKSDEIVRARNNNGTIPLGVGPEKSYPTYYYREVDSVIMGPPKLAWFDIGDKTTLSEFLPIVTTAGKDNLSNPVFLYIWLGAERISWVGFVPNALDIVHEYYSGSHYSYYTTIEALSKVFVRGRQLHCLMATWSDPSSNEEYRNHWSESVRLRISYVDEYIGQDKTILVKLASSSSVPGGSIVGLVGDYVLTKTTISDKGLTKVTPPPSEE